MTQSNKSQPSKRARGNRGSSAPASNRGGTQSKNAMRVAPTKSGVVRQPVGNTTGQSPMRARIDRALPPFTRQRYVAIWAGLLVPLVFVLLVLTQCNGGTSQPQAAQPTATATTQAVSQGAATATNSTVVVEQTPSPAEAPVASPPPSTANAGSEAATAAVTTSPGASTTGAASTGGAGGAGKNMIIDTDKGRIVAKLHTEPDAGVSKTIANFEQKANSGEFNGRTFHRVEDWVIQGGDPVGNGTGGGKMPSEYNQLPFKIGALGVARGQDSAINNDSQFFIVKKDSDFLNGQYTNFGQVVEGMDAVNQISIGDKIIKISVEERK